MATIFVPFLSHHYEFTNYFEILIFAVSYKFTLNPQFRSFQFDLANFDKHFLLIRTMLYIVNIWQSLIKFWDGSCPRLHHLAWNNPQLILFLQNLVGVSPTIQNPGFSYPTMHNHVQNCKLWSKPVRSYISAAGINCYQSFLISLQTFIKVYGQNDFH